jgi:hypothetical protein
VETGAGSFGVDLILTAGTSANGAETGTGSFGVDSIVTVGISSIEGVDWPLIGVDNPLAGVDEDAEELALLFLFLLFFRLLFLLFLLFLLYFLAGIFVIVGLKKKWFYRGKRKKQRLFFKEASWNSLYSYLTLTQQTSTHRV